MPRIPLIGHLSRSWPIGAKKPDPLERNGRMRRVTAEMSDSCVPGDGTIRDSRKKKGLPQAVMA